MKMEDEWIIDNLSIVTDALENKEITEKGEE